MAAGRPAMTEPHSIETAGLVWMALHGTICLELRHPAYTGPSRPLVVSFVRELGMCLVQWGVLTAAELEAVENFEREESVHGDV